MAPGLGGPGLLLQRAASAESWLHRRFGRGAMVNRTLAGDLGRIGCDDLWLTGVCIEIVLRDILGL